MSDMAHVVCGDSTDIDTYFPLFDGNEFFFFLCKGIIQFQAHGIIFQSVTGSQLYDNCHRFLKETGIYDSGLRPPKIHT